MNYQEILEKAKVVFSGGLPKNVKIYLTISLAWIILIGYLTWWNGLKSPMLDKSFRSVSYTHLTLPTKRIV